MSELAERARKSAVEMMHATRANYDIKNDLVMLEASIDTFAGFIEQALLAERRLAMESAIRLACGMCREGVPMSHEADLADNHHNVGAVSEPDYRWCSATYIRRAAAVATPRGGE